MKSSGNDDMITADVETRKAVAEALIHKRKPRRADTYRAARRNAAKARKMIWRGRQADWYQPAKARGKQYPYNSVKRGWLRS